MDRYKYLSSSRPSDGGQRHNLTHVGTRLRPKACMLTARCLRLGTVLSLRRAGRAFESALFLITCCETLFVQALVAFIPVLCPHTMPEDFIEEFSDRRTSTIIIMKATHETHPSTLRKEGDGRKACTCLSPS